MSHSLPTPVLYYGKDEPLPDPVPLRAGPLTLIYEAGDLRYVKLGKHEVLRRVYAAVRDRNWGTIPGRLQNVKLDVREDSFRVSYDSVHRERDIHFVWHGEISGEPDGRIRFSLDGEAKTTFLKNRIGFCVLHPIHECAGAACRVEYVSGATATLSFPEQVAAEQPVKGMDDLVAVAHPVVPGVWAEVRFEGDLFEMEDQRNWIDASYKTFCTPLHLPFPVEIKAGQRVWQQVTLQLKGIEDAVLRIVDPEPRIGSLRAQTRSSHCQFSVFGSQPRHRLPSVGLGAPYHNLLNHERQVTRLQALKPTHLRFDLRMSEPNWPGALWKAASDACDCGARLELAVYLTTASPIRMKDLAQRLAADRNEIARLILFPTATKTSPEAVLKRARKQLVAEMGDVPIGGGTDADFYQLNQFRPPAELCDFICWSMNPQVHAFDNASLAETPAAIPAQIESARACFPDKPLVVSPITLKPRFNPVATSAESSADPNELPPEVDPRQMSLFGAGWTLASFKALAESGVDSVTFYETTGWRGVMETEAGSPLPEKFRSIPGGVFPLYHVLADIGELAGGEVVPSQSSAPLRVDGLVLRKGAKQRLLLVNLTGKPQLVVAGAIAGRAHLKRLNETTAEFAMREPEAFRAAVGQTAEPRDGRFELDLMPFEVVRMDYR